MGCLSSKAKEDPVEPIDQPPEGDHGSLTGGDGGEGTSTSAQSRASRGSGVSGPGDRPVPKARRFTEDGAVVATGPKNVLTKRVVSTDGDGGADAPLDSDDELEAQMRAPRATPSGVPARAEADADAAAAKKKKKKDKNRLTDLEDYDLEGEDPETTEEMLRRKASKKAGDSRVMQKVFGDIDDISDDDTPRGGRLPALGPLGAGPLGGPAPGFGGGPLVVGAGVRKPGLAPLAPLGARAPSPSDTPPMASFLAPVRRPAAAQITPGEPTPVYRRDDSAREEEERRIDAAAPAEPTDPDGDFEWRDDEDGAAPTPAPPSFAPDPADGDFEWRDDALGAPSPAPPSFAHDPAEEDLEWRDDELAPRLDEHAAATRLQAAQRGRAARARVAELKAELRRAEAEVASPAEDAYEDEFEDDFEAEESAPDDERERHAAATKLQAAQRGRIARTEVARLRARRDEEATREPEYDDAFESNDDDARETAATRLQAAQRGRAARARVAELRAQVREAEAAVAAEERYEDEFEDDFEAESPPPAPAELQVEVEAEKMHSPMPAATGPSILDELYELEDHEKDALDEDNHFEPAELETPMQTPRKEVPGAAQPPSPVPESAEDPWSGFQETYGNPGEGGGGLDDTFERADERRETVVAEDDPHLNGNVADSSPPQPVSDGWADGDLDDGLEAGGEVDYDDVLEDVEDDVF
jgi:hypothetical protein